MNGTASPNENMKTLEKVCTLIKQLRFQLNIRNLITARPVNYCNKNEIEVRRCLRNENVDDACVPSHRNGSLRVLGPPRSLTKLQLLLINWAIRWVVVRVQSAVQSCRVGRNWRRLSIEYSKLVAALTTAVRQLSFDPESTGLDLFYHSRKHRTDENKKKKKGNIKKKKVSIETLLRLDINYHYRLDLVPAVPFFLFTLDTPSFLLTIFLVT